jgi:hypothetical protein
LICLITDAGLHSIEEPGRASAFAASPRPGRCCRSSSGSR